jgi:predicted O-methyltransferase YrrM
MDTSLSWDTLLFLQSVKEPSTFLKVMSEIWGVEVRSIVEIGVYEGKTSKKFRALFPNAFLYLIDPWELYEEYTSVEAGPESLTPSDYEKAYNKVQEIFAQDKKVKIIRKTSMEALDDVPEADLIFIDGNHSYASVKQDIEHWLPKLRPGGMFAGHDYDPRLFPGVIEAVNDSFPEGIILGYDHTWLKHKTSK